MEGMGGEYKFNGKKEHGWYGGGGGGGGGGNESKMSFCL